MSSSSEQPRSSRLKNLAKNLAVFAVTFLLCLVAAEIVLRALGYGHVEIYEPDPLLYWRLKPNQDCFTKIDRKPVHINSHGTRGREFQVPKPPDTLRILMLGDSRTFGWGLTEAESYAGLVEAALQKALAGRRRVEVINGGVNAWSYSQMLLFFRERALAWQPDIVVVGNANLWTQFSEKSSPEFIRQFMSRVRLKNFLRRFALYHFVVEVQLKEFYERTRTKFIPVDPQADPLFKEQQQADPDALFREAIGKLCELAKAKGVTPVMMHLPVLDELETGRAGRDFAVKQQITKQQGVVLVELMSDMKGRGKAIYLDADPVHHNVAGNEIISQRLLQTLIPLVTP